MVMLYVLINLILLQNIGFSVDYYPLGTEDPTDYTMINKAVNFIKKKRLN